MDESAQQTEVGRIVDHVRAEHPTSFEVLLGAGVFAAEVEAYLDTSGDDSGGKDQASTA